MLDRAHRFHGLNSLSYAYRRGQTVRGAQLSLKYALNHRRGSYRAAVVVSKKVDKSAVVRNRIRRRIYEAIRLQQTKITEPYDLIFSAYSAQLADMDTGALHKLVRTQLQKAGAVKAPGHPHAIVKPEE